MATPRPELNLDVLSLEGMWVVFFLAVKTI